MPCTLVHGNKTYSNRQTTYCYKPNICNDRHSTILFILCCIHLTGGNRGLLFTPITKVNFNTHDIGSICFSVFLYEVICILKTYCPLICMHNTNYVIRIVHLVTNYIIRIVHLVLCLKRINIKSVNVCTGNGNSINQRSSSFPKVWRFFAYSKTCFMPPLLSLQGSN